VPLAAHSPALRASARACADPPPGTSLAPSASNGSGVGSRSAAAWNWGRA